MIFTCTDVSMMDQCFLTMPLTLGRSVLNVMTNGRTALFAAFFFFGLYGKRLCLSILNDTSNVTDSVFAIFLKRLEQLNRTYHH